MSNFQRSRSKVWWGDSPPNIGSPIAQGHNWDARRRQANEEQWEPQLPHWAPQEQPLPEVDEEIDVSSPGLPLRQNSPGSHKSQDSGFSDSDSSPSAVQQQNALNAAKANDDAPKAANEQPQSPKTPARKDLNDEAAAYLHTPKSVSKYLTTPVRSVIKTPKDVQNYLEACCEIGHQPFDSPKPHAKKNLTSVFEETNRIEYIQLSPSQQIAVNNMPRVRSPITRINYHAPVHFQRGELNRSFNCVRRLDEEILDEGPHSLSYVENFPQRKVTDSLDLKSTKKTAARARQKILSKCSKGKTNNRGFLNFLPKKGESIKTIHDITRDSVDRVPTLGLPAAAYEERCIDDHVSAKSPRGILKTPAEGRKITPPPQFQDITRKSPKGSPRLGNRELSLCPDEIDFNPPSPNGASTPLGKKACAKIRPVNLLENFNVSAAANSTDKKNSFCGATTTLERISKDQPAPVKHWLCEQVGFYEPECMTTLQSKAIGVEMNNKITSSSATITGNIRKVQTYGQIIAHQYKQISSDLKNMNASVVEQHGTEIRSLVANVNEFVLTHSITLKIKPPGETPERWDKIKVALHANMQRISEMSEDISVELNETFPEMGVLSKHLKTMLDIFVETARAVLIQQIRTLLTILEEPPSDMILKSTLTSLGHLGALTTPEDLAMDTDDPMSLVTNLPFIECGIPRALLSVIIESNKFSIKALSLRALSTICITKEALCQFEEAGGVEIISDILNEKSNPEPQMREAITLLTQITAPWIQGDYCIEEIHNYLDKIIKNITDLLSKTSCCQLLLLCTACLVNLIGMAKKKERNEMTANKTNQTSDIIEIISKHKTIDNLLEAVKKRGPNVSVFLQEQTAAFINIISTSTKGQVSLASCSATTVALICFLRAPCPSPIRAANLQSEFRLINQAAEALARLCILREVTMQVLQLEGVTRLIRVIQAQKIQKMNGKCSDQILVNCLRALRLVAKHHSNCFDEIDTDTTNMIEPPLMESVKIYSAKQESYV